MSEEVTVSVANTICNFYFHDAITVLTTGKLLLLAAKKRNENEKFGLMSLRERVHRGRIFRWKILRQRKLLFFKEPFQRVPEEPPKTKSE